MSSSKVQKEQSFAPYDLHSFPDTQGILVSTMNDIPGYRITKVLGAVYGLTVRSRNIFAGVGAGLKSIIGGELGAMSKMLYDSRNEAADRMIGECVGKGGNAIIAMRFDSGEIAQGWSQVAAYGTAVIIEKL